MKKWISAMLALLLIVSIGVLPAQAAKEKQTVQKTQTQQEKQTTLPAPIDSALVCPAFEKKPLYDSHGSASVTLTTDDVTIDADSGEVTVVTASGTEMSATVPFGAYCITQDVHQQLEIYMSLYSDVSSALKYYISNGIHMDIFDFCAGTSIYISESDDTLAALVGELNTPEEGDGKQIANYLSENWYGGRKAVLKTLGGNQYIAFDLSKEYGFVVYIHFTNGKLIEVYTFCEDGAKGMERVEAMLESLTFGPVETPEEEP